MLLSLLERISSRAEYGSIRASGFDMRNKQKFAFIRSCFGWTSPESRQNVHPAQTLILGARLLIRGKVEWLVSSVAGASVPNGDNFGLLNAWKLASNERLSISYASSYNSLQYANCSNAACFPTNLGCSLVASFGSRRLGRLRMNYAKDPLKSWFTGGG
ncbi:uncharacterized protein FOMMEDRAFT_164815 [Fomitiporia mediterranea MF3/22]|uniref:uncharacterized protein n=1 Tax=Fomitiporia mediterranea (strain MF3/22) TaxID=694068 RepID=UPI0004408CA4|nr:uncharacterized protein FOMMEDRAFT_164815 [Fomitiporia mediterranea MF3/22]EJD08055.1 hypothetical protein FOMMEDRAFT_164815 [Fomitiporia mediterranea MF3/22]